jgi:hypothetical protein
MKELNALYLTLFTFLQDFFAEEEGNEQTGLLLNIVIVVVLAGLLLALLRVALPELWDGIMTQIQNLWNP